jgi:hypothetical protein
LRKKTEGQKSRATVPLSIIASFYAAPGKSFDAAPACGSYPIIQQANLLTRTKINIRVEAILSFDFFMIDIVVNLLKENVIVCHIFKNLYTSISNIKFGAVVVGKFQLPKNDAAPCGSGSVTQLLSLFNNSQLCQVTISYDSFFIDTV